MGLLGVFLILYPLFTTRIIAESIWKIMKVYSNTNAMHEQLDVMLSFFSITILLKKIKSCLHLRKEEMISLHFILSPLICITKQSHARGVAQSNHA